MKPHTGILAEAKAEETAFAEDSVGQRSAAHEAGLCQVSGGHSLRPSV